MWLSHRLLDIFLAQDDDNFVTIALHDENDDTVLFRKLVDLRTEFIRATKTRTLLRYTS